MVNACVQTSVFVQMDRLLHRAVHVVSCFVCLKTCQFIESVRRSVSNIGVLSLRFMYTVRIGVCVRVVA